jgi:hypothetical protein
MNKQVEYKKELKLLFVLCYYAFAGSMIIIAFTYNAANKTELVSAMMQYLACETMGTSTNCDAKKKAYEPLAGAEIWIVTYLFIAAFPAIELIYVIKPAKLKLCSCTCIKGKQTPPADLILKNTLRVREPDPV